MEYTVPDCIGKCLNGGACQNGACACREGFEGETCAVEGKNRFNFTTHFFIVVKEGGLIGWIIVFTILILVAVGLYLGAQELKKRQQNNMDVNMREGNRRIQ